MKLWEPSKCCCFQLRTGNLILGFLSLIGGCLTIIKGIYILNFSITAFRIACKGEPNAEKCVTLAWYYELGIISTSIVACFHIVFGSLFLYGIFKQKTAYFIPLMTLYTVKIGLLVLGIVIAIPILLYKKFLIGAVLIYAASMGLAIFLMTFFLLVIRSYYYEIKRAEGHIHVALNEERT